MDRIDFVLNKVRCADCKTIVNEDDIIHENNVNRCKKCYIIFMGHMQDTYSNYDEGKIYKVEHAEATLGSSYITVLYDA